MTAAGEDEILKHLERECRPQCATFDVEMRPEDIVLMRELAARWDAHPIHALGRAVRLASELQEASQRGAKVTVRWPRLRRRRSYEVAANYKGPTNR